MYTKKDAKYMLKAMRLAAQCRAEARADPAPKVGVVIVKDDQELAEAFHGQDNSGAHAEFLALSKCADDMARGATLYTTLEPCVGPRTEGKKPCALWVVEKGLKRVVIGALDRNPYVLGKGWAFLSDNGLDVDVAPAAVQREIEQTNELYVRFHRRNWITIAPKLGAEDLFESLTGAISEASVPEMRGALYAFLRKPQSNDVAVIHDVLGSVWASAQRSERAQEVVDTAGSVWLEALDSNADEAVPAAICLRDMMSYFGLFPSSLTQRGSSPRPLSVRLASDLALLSYNPEASVSSKDAWEGLPDPSQPLPLRMIAAWIIGLNLGASGYDRGGQFVTGTQVLVGIAEKLGREPLPLQRAIVEALDVIPRRGGADNNVLEGLAKAFEKASTPELRKHAARCFLKHYPKLVQSAPTRREHYATYESIARKVIA